MDEKELDDLIDAYATMVRSLCRKYFLIGGNEDDLFQEGMIGLLEACKNFDKSLGDYSSPAFKKFATVCIKRQVFDAIKKANTQKNQALNSYVSFNQKNQEDDDFELEFDATNSGTNNPEQIFLNQETTDEMMLALKKQLSDFEVLVLDEYLSGIKQAEIARRLNKEVKQIDNTIQRIKKKAQNCINKM